MGDFKKYHNYSTVFVGREQEANSISYHNLGVENHKDLKSNTSKQFRQFVDLLNVSEQREHLSKNAPQIFDAIQDIIDKVSYEQDLIKFVLPLLDGILTDDRKNIQFIIRNITNNGDKTLITALQRILQDPKHNIIVHEAAAKILAFIYSELDSADFGGKQKDFLKQLLALKDSQLGNQQIKIGNYNFMTALVNLLKIESLVPIFLQNGGQNILSEFLKKYSNDLQIAYYTLLNVWLISFSQEAQEHFADPTLGLIKSMTEVIQRLSREKLVRVAFGTFRNLCGNKDAIELMVDAQLIRFVEIQLKGNIKDQEVIEDLQHVGEVLEANLKILSSFEKYQKEIHSRHLDWSPVHTEKFWRENIRKFEDDDFKLIKMLISLLDDSNTKNQAVACYDLGEFCRFYPYGRHILDGQNGKSKIMLLAKSEDQKVRENALLALQKIMLHNWNIQGQ
ncbi:Armadillo-type fold [Pseudocohnilembus persalinus]|uniref:V-type proton ATPase subunit H n=1 Tax=Pseudocohnilembus persalinus TaxID=266149 RepID=A0A0V0QS56_PSEPJ|nr:Armadillo-type fold [Pseudocohnilembus persalinus]|eukprot:KRX04842.1 Armadillo-type fold [Pseudocohnilembus persalinus]